MQFTIGIRSKVIIEGYKGRIKDHAKVLDIGCGNGLVAKNLAAHFNCQFVGADINNYLEYPMPFARVVDGYKLPFKDKEFDIAMLNDSLHHCERDLQLKVMKEALRVGKKVLIFETKPTIMAKIIDVVLNKIHSKLIPVPFTHKDLKTWLQIFEEQGLHYEYGVPKIPFWYPMVHYVFVLQEKG